jgi:hypothetical protein
MAGLKEIRTKIKTVQNMQKITYAMEMVAQSKMRKVRERMCAPCPYGEKIRNVDAAPNFVQSIMPDNRLGQIIFRDRWLDFALGKALSKIITIC